VCSLSWTLQNIADQLKLRNLDLGALLPKLKASHAIHLNGDLLKISGNKQALISRLRVTMTLEAEAAGSELPADGAVKATKSKGKRSSASKKKPAAKRRRVSGDAKAAAASSDTDEASDDSETDSDSEDNAADDGLSAAVERPRRALMPTRRSLSAVVNDIDAWQAIQDAKV